MAGTRHRTACSGRQALAGLAGSMVLPARAQQAPPVEEKFLPSPQVGSPLPLPELALLDGTRFRAPDDDGHALVLHWKACWSPFCAHQAPWMDNFWLTHKACGSLLLGQSVDRKAEDASNCLSKKGCTFSTGLVSPAVARVLPTPRDLHAAIVRGRDGRFMAAGAGQLFPEYIEQFGRFF